MLSPEERKRVKGMMTRPSNCPDIHDNKEEKNQSSTKKTRPIIDLFLNPERKDELKHAFSQPEVKKSNVTFTKVCINNF